MHMISSDDQRERPPTVFFSPSVTEENEGEDASSSDSDVEEAKKSKYRHRLLRHKLTMSDGESEEEKKGKSKEAKEVKRRNRRKGIVMRGVCGQARHCPVATVAIWQWLTWTLNGEELWSALSEIWPLLTSLSLQYEALQHQKLCPLHVESE